MEQAQKQHRRAEPGSGAGAASATMFNSSQDFVNAGRDHRHRPCTRRPRSLQADTTAATVTVAAGVHAHPLTSPSAWPASAAPRSPTVEGGGTQCRPCRPGWRSRVKPLGDIAREGRRASPTPSGVGEHRKDNWDEAAKEAQIQIEQTHRADRGARACAPNRRSRTRPTTRSRSTTSSSRSTS